MNPVNQKEVDQKMFDLDGTDNKGKLGANAILAVSMATCKVLHHTLVQGFSIGDPLSACTASTDPVCCCP